MEQRFPTYWEIFEKCRLLTLELKEIFATENRLIIEQYYRNFFVELGVFFCYFLIVRIALALRRKSGTWV